MPMRNESEEHLSWPQKPLTEPVSTLCRKRACDLVILQKLLESLDFYILIPYTELLVSNLLKLDLGMLAGTVIQPTFLILSIYFIALLHYIELNG